ncbi:hypothetical protein [Pseudoclavibacter helvolus]|uniref:hypothetical protein n=1 Tax=Pseudoclavibacter helvolus TaxID=255205 RepID=UPI003C742BD8
MSTAANNKSPDINRHRLLESLGWLKKAAGVDDEYLSRWPSEAWWQWHLAMRADPQGPNPAVPTWMRPLLGRWHRDFGMPFPCVGQLWPTTREWFGEADTHADLTLRVETTTDGGEPNLTQLRAAWTRAVDLHLTPVLSMSLEPAAPWGEAVVGTIEAFYVIGGKAPWQEHEEALGPDDRASFAQILGTPGASTSVMLTNSDTQGLPLLAWEWLYG